MGLRLPLNRSELNKGALKGRHHVFAPSLTMSEVQEPFRELNTGIVVVGDEEIDKITDDEFLQYRQKCERFRVLLTGAELVGKTTLLERVGGDSIDKAQIKSPDGDLVRKAGF